ncbi:hypothetical protein OKW33_000286 [Paraburkholderia atlantica]
MNRLILAVAAACVACVAPGAAVRRSRGALAEVHFAPRETAVTNCDKLLSDAIPALPIASGKEKALAMEGFRL